MWTKESVSLSTNPYTSVESKFLQALKMGWMFFWRAWLIDLFFFDGQSVVINEVIMAISGIAALIMVYGFKFSVSIFPILSLLRRKNWLIPLKGNTWLYGGLRPPSRPKTRYPSIPETSYGYPSVSSTTTIPRPRPRPSTAPAVTYAQETKGLGITTGYEPRYLDQVVPTPWRFTFGDPGAGLSSSGFTQQAIQAGQRGERNFYLALSKANLLDKVASFWSVALPDNSFRRVDDTDIDCILISNTTVYLIDLKMYKQGDLTYLNNGETIYAIDNQTGGMVGPPKTASGQMLRAYHTFSNLLLNTPYRRLDTLITLMPTNRGMGVVNCEWPGGIKAVGLPQMLEIVASDVHANGSFVQKDPRLIQNLSRLVK